MEKDVGKDQTGRGRKITSEHALYVAEALVEQSRKRTSQHEHEILHGIAAIRKKKKTSGHLLTLYPSSGPSSLVNFRFLYCTPLQSRSVACPVQIIMQLMHWQRNYIAEGTAVTTKVELSSLHHLALSMRHGSWKMNWNSWRNMKRRPWQVHR